MRVVSIVACLLIFVGSAGADDSDAPEMIASTLASFMGVYIGDASAEPPEQLPDGAMPAPLPPSMPLTDGLPPPGAEWFLCRDDFVEGPFTSSQLRQRISESDDHAARIWRAGETAWRGEGGATWIAPTATEAPPPPMPGFLVQALPPPAISAAPQATWFKMDWGQTSWRGPFTAAELGYNARVWNIALPIWLDADASADNSPGPRVDPAKPLPTISQAPAAETTAASIDSVAIERLQGHWVMTGSASGEPYIGPVLEVVIDRRGVLSVRSTDMLDQGALIQGGRWLVAQINAKMTTDGTYILSAAFQFPRLPLGYPVAFQMSVIDDNTLREDWSGFTLKRQSRLFQ